MSVYAGPLAPQGLQRSPGSVVKAYLALTKPRIIELLLVTTVPTMLLAARGLPSWRIVAATLIGGMLAAGSANALNCYVDRDIDELMRRTRGRPLARHLIAPRHALAFGIALGMAATAWLALTTNVLSASLADATILFYVFVYSIGLKRRTSQNVVWGGAAGCMPVVIGWSAVTGTVSVTAAVLFLVIFFWTPPHTWALGLRYREDYAAAQIPMLPVVATADVVAGRIIVYTWLMVASSLVLWPLATSWLYGGAAIALGAVFLAFAYRLRAQVRSGGAICSFALFKWSNTYLSLLFLAVALDAIVMH
ncbi:MAG: protoheme IX farnesyltransferase [Pseudonocardiales bacterium]|nr:MAG: protoheme IX farnesyltransferase [Pseudonocardiales bacterium]